MRRLLSLFLVGLSLHLSPSIALSQPKNTEEEKQLAAQKRFEEAEKLYNIGDFEGALTGYKEAYLLSNNPDLLFNMGQCYRKLGKYDDALITYRSYLREVPNSPVKADVEARIAEVEKEKATPRFSEIVITSNPPGAEVRKGGSKSRVIGTTPFTLKDLPPGEHHFTLTLPGFEPYELDLASEGGKNYVIPEAKLSREVSYKPIWAYRLTSTLLGFTNATSEFGAGFVGPASHSSLERYSTKRNLLYGPMISFGVSARGVGDNVQTIGHLLLGGTLSTWKPLKRPLWSLSYGGAAGLVGLDGVEAGLGLYAYGHLRLIREGEYRGAVFIRPLAVGLWVGDSYQVLDLSLLGLGYSWGLRNKNKSLK